PATFTLSLHAALPISAGIRPFPQLFDRKNVPHDHDLLFRFWRRPSHKAGLHILHQYVHQVYTTMGNVRNREAEGAIINDLTGFRSEEHTSELQSRENL